MLKAFCGVIAVILIGCASTQTGNRETIGRPLFSDPDRIPRGEALEDTVVGAIENAKKEILIEMFDLNDSRICTAIKDAYAKKVTVRMIIDPKQGHVQEAIICLRPRHEIGIALGSTPGYHHTKILIVDSSVVYIGSYNYTEGATTRNDELLQPLYDSEIARLYSKHFWEGYDSFDKLPIPREQ